MADATKRSLQGRSATEFFTLYACKNVVITTICLGSYLCMQCCTCTLAARAQNGQNLRPRRTCEHVLSNRGARENDCEYWHAVKSQMTANLSCFFDSRPVMSLCKLGVLALRQAAQMNSLKKMAWIHAIDSEGRPAERMVILKLF